MFSGWTKRVRTGSFAAAALILAGSGITIVATSSPAAAYDSNSSWTVAGQSATTTSVAGVQTTVTTSGAVALTGSAPLSSQFSPSSSQFRPNLSLATNTLRWTVDASCLEHDSCAVIGAITLTFDHPVRNPVLHLEGIGALAQSSSGSSAIHATYTLDRSASGNATLAAASAGASNLAVEGDTITTANDNASTTCTSNASGPSGPSTQASAGCGSVAINGTVTSVKFDVGVFSTVLTGIGSTSSSGDAVGLAVTFDQNYSSAPASYDHDSTGPNAPRHTIGDLALGSGVSAANTSDPDSTSSPSAVPPGHAIGGAAGDAVRQWPTLTTAMLGSSYTVSVPISGASRPGQVCGYLDFAHTGDFSAAADRACADFGRGDHGVTLTWTVPSTMTAGLTYARLRAAYDPSQAQRPTGPAASGEVEDSTLRITPTITVKSTLPDGTAGGFELAVNNTVVIAGASVAVTTDADLGAAPAAVTVSESPSSANGFSGANYTVAVRCVDGFGNEVAGNSMVQSVSIPRSGNANGPQQNIVCTFNNVGVASLSAVASVTPTNVSAVGQSIDYRVVLTNTGPVPLSALAVTASQAVSCPVTALAPAAWITCTASATAGSSVFDSGRALFTASASAHDPSGVEVDARSTTASVTATQRTSLTVAATSSPATVDAAGQAVSYTFTVTNGGNVTIHGVQVAARSGQTSLPVHCAATTLAAAATTSCTTTYAVTAADLDAGTITATANAVGLDPAVASVSAAPATVTTRADQQPKLEIVQVANPAVAATAGQQITFSVTVTNSGNITLNSISVTDTITAPGGPSPVVSCPATKLAAAAQVTCTATYLSTKADINNGLIENRATGSATTLAGGKVSSQVSTVIVRAADGPALTLFASASPAAVVVAGEVVHYNFLLQNSGNVALSGLTLQNSSSTPGAPLSINCTVAALAPAAVTNCTADYTTLSADIDAAALVSTTVANAVDPGGKPVKSNVSVATVSTSAAASISVQSSTSSAELTAPGQPVDYSLVVTNTGNLSLSAVAVKQSIGSRPVTVTCSVATLGPAESTTCTSTYTTTQADVNARSIRSTGIASATAANGDTVSATAATTTVAAAAAAALAVTAVATPTRLDATGETVDFAYLVTNTGNAPVSGLHVTDTVTSAQSPLAVRCAATTLNPNASTTCTAPPYTATQADVDHGKIANAATATATAATASITSAPSTVDTVIVAPSGLHVDLGGHVNGSATVGDEVTWQAVVTNSGLTTVHDLTLTLPSGASAPCAQTVLAPSASVNCTLPHQTVDEVDTNVGQVTTAAVAAGTSVSGPIASQRAVFAVAVAAPIPLTGVAGIGPTLSAGVGAFLAGIGLLMLAGPRQRYRRRAA